MPYRGNTVRIKQVYDRTRRAAYAKLKTLYPELTADGSFYNFIRLYKGIYQGYNTDENSIYRGTKFTIDGGYGDSDYKIINGAKIVTKRMVKLSFSEHTKVVIDNGEVEVELKPGEQPKEAEPTLQDWFDDAFEENDLIGSLIKYGERSFYALGGLAGVPRFIDGKLEFEFTDSDLFIPMSWRKDNITESVTAEILKKNQIYYLLVTEFTVDEVGAKETYQLFKGDKTGSSFNKPVKDIESVIPGQPIEVELKGFTSSSLVYTTNAEGNNKTYDTPLGLSIYANSIDTLTALAQAMDVFFSEFKNGRKRIMVPTTELKERIDPTTGQPIKYFDAKSDVYQAYNSKNSTAKIEDMTSELRVEEILAAIQGLLNILATEVGESAGTFTFNAVTGGITATEVVSKNSDTFKTKRLHEKKWESFIRNLILKTLEILETEEVDLEKPMPKVNKEKLKITVTFDDSIITDDKANREESRTEVSQGLRSTWDYMTNPKDGRGLSDEEAQEEVDRISQAEEEEFDRFSGEEGDDDNDPTSEFDMDQCIAEVMSQSGKSEEEAKLTCQNKKQKSKS